jgi:hypothetical protein
MTKPAAPRRPRDPKPHTTAWFRLCVEGSLTAIEVQSIRGLAQIGYQPDQARHDNQQYLKWRKTEGARHPDLAAAYISNLHRIQSCREAIERGDLWELAYHIRDLKPGFITFFAKKGERSFMKLRSAGQGRNAHLRDVAIAREFLLLKDADPSRARSKPVQEKLAKSAGMNWEAWKKAVNRGKRIIHRESD